MSYSDISQEQAQWLFAEGAILVFLDVPCGTEFGIDYCSWEVGEQFKGVKMIPPGIHFVYYSAVSKQGQVAPRTGFMYNFQAHEIVVRVWDPLTEDIRTEPVSSELQSRIASNRQELDRYLGIYPYDKYKKWVSLTDFVSPTLLVQLQPLHGKIYAATPLQSVGSTTESRRAQMNTTSVVPPTEPSCSKSSPFVDDIDNDPRLPKMDALPGSTIRFTSIPWKANTGSCPSEVTTLGMDRSVTLESVLASYPSEVGAETGILGELQFAFICFIVGQVFEAFDSWKSLVRLLCSCVDAVSLRPQLYMRLLSVLHHHITEIPEDFFVDIVSRNNFLTDALRSLFENIDAADERACDVKGRGRRFRAHLEKKFSWDFSAETGEYAPVVVDLSD